jgi:hypothetical protein
MAVLPTPEVLFIIACEPMAVLKLPPAFSSSAYQPSAEFCWPVFSSSA